MRETTTYQKFLTAVSGQTEQAVSIMTKEQVETASDKGAETLSDGFVENMKVLAAIDLRNAQLNDAMSNLQMLLDGDGRLLSNFPKAELVAGVRGDKRCLVIWLDGKPDDGGLV